MPIEDKPHELWYYDNNDMKVIQVTAYERDNGFFYVPTLGVTTTIGGSLFKKRRQAYSSGVRKLEDKIRMLETHLDRLKEEADD